MQRQQIKTPPAEFCGHGQFRGVGIAEIGVEVALHQRYALEHLTLGAFPDDGQSGRVNVVKAQTAPEGRFEQPELRFIARSDGKGGKIAVGRRQTVQYANGAHETRRHIRLLVRVARPDLVLAEDARFRHLEPALDQHVVRRVQHFTALLVRGLPRAILASPPVMWRPDYVL